MKQHRRKRVIKAAGACALMSVLIEQPHGVNAAEDQIEMTSKTALPNRIQKTKNFVGCEKTSVSEPSKGGEYLSSRTYYSRPTNLDVETLSDAELRSCGLPSKRRVRGLPKSSSEYQAWLASAQAAVKAKQGDPLQPLPTPRPALVPIHRTSSFNQKYTKPPLDNYSLSPQTSVYHEFKAPTFAERTVVDDDYLNAINGYTTITSVAVVPPAYTLPPNSPSNHPVTTATSYWVGYQEAVDSGTGGTSLAQAGILDYVATDTVVGGQFFRQIFPFAEFVPDSENVRTDMVIQPGDTVSFEVDYDTDKSFSYIIMDSNAVGLKVVTGSETLSSVHQSACGSGNSGAGGPNLCNNGSIVEWVFEDLGQYNLSTNTVSPGHQIPPATPTFGAVKLELPQAYWGNGDEIVPDNVGCSNCQYLFSRYDLTDPGVNGSAALSIGADSLNGNGTTKAPRSLVFTYSGPGYPGYNWPTY